MWKKCEHVLRTQSPTAGMLYVVQRGTCTHFWPGQCAGKGVEQVWDEREQVWDAQCFRAGWMFTLWAWAAHSPLCKPPSATRLP